MIRRAAMDIVKTADNAENHTLYMSFTKYGKSVHEKENKKFLDNTELDYELEILSETEYESLKTVYNIIEKSIASGSLY